jgi:deoxyadenosine/deoxycytidine kinase
MSDEQLEQLRDEWSVRRKAVLCPTLVILLDVAASELVGRVRQRAQAYERALTADWLDALSKAFRRQATAVETGPVMHVDATRPDATEEVAAAVQAISSAGR